MGTVYCIRCLGCKEKLDPDTKEQPGSKGGVKSSNYIGRTTVSIHNRLITHREGHERGNSSNALVKHDIEKHNGEKQSYSAVVAQREIGLLNLVLREAILIEGQEEGCSMNDKMEFGRGATIRIQAAKSGVT